MRKTFITGLLALIPLVITAWVLYLVVETMDRSLLLLPHSWRPDAWLGFHVYGAGVILTIIVIFVVGLLVQNVIGEYLVRLWESLLKRIPVVGSLYFGVKRVSDTLFSPTGNAFRQAVMVQYPKNGSWVIAFVTGTPEGEVQKHLDGDYLSIYVPTTPNPTSGFFLMMPRSDVVMLDMSVDGALKYIISMGVLAPSEPPVS